MASDQGPHSKTTPAAAPARAATPAAGRSQASERLPQPASAEAVKIELLMNARYHATREAFLDSTHRWLMFAVIGLGAVAITDLAPHDYAALAKEAATAMAALAAALDLTFDLSNRARTHSMLKRRYFELMASVSEGATDASGAMASMHRISADEEPPYNALLKASWNDAQETVYGDSADAYRIPRSHRALQNYLRFDGVSYDLLPAKTA